MAKKKQSDNEIIDEVIAQSAPAPELDLTTLPEEVIEEVVAAPVIVVEEPAKGTKEPGMYYKGKKFKNTASRLGKKWVIIVDGKRVKVLKSDIEFVK